MSERAVTDSSPVRVMLADDHLVVRRGLRQVLEDAGGFEIVAEAGDVPSTVRLVQEHRPDVLTLDLNMPGGSTLEAIPRLRSASPETRIVVLTMQSDPYYVRRALGAGAIGYVLKDARDEELIEAVRRAVAGHRSALAATLAAEDGDGRQLGLSERERDVLRMVALGHTNNEIADRLFLSVRTVETHRAHIQQKLGLRARSDLVRYALEHRLVDVS